MRETRIEYLKKAIDQNGTPQDKERIASFVKIRCCFCQGVGHIAKSCKSKTKLYRFVRSKGNRDNG